MNDPFLKALKGGDSATVQAASSTPSTPASTTDAAEAFQNLQDQGIYRFDNVMRADEYATTPR